MFSPAFGSIHVLLKFHLAGVALFMLLEEDTRRLFCNPAHRLRWRLSLALLRKPSFQMFSNLFPFSDFARRGEGYFLLREVSVWTSIPSTWPSVQVQYTWHFPWGDTTCISICYWSLHRPSIYSQFSSFLQHREMQDNKYHYIAWRGMSWPLPAPVLAWTSLCRVCVSLAHITGVIITPVLPNSAVLEAMSSSVLIPLAFDIESGIQVNLYT